jgi:hypothetical protein
MAITTIGKTILDGVTFDTDPQIYEPLNWPKRHSVHRGIGGVVTIQDFGTFKKDNTIRLVSGATGFMNQATVDSFHVKFRTKGATFTFTDWLDNEFAVFILRFRPVATFIGESDSDNLYTYEMDLHVLDIITLFGTTFVGP